MVVVNQVIIGDREEENWVTQPSHSSLFLSPPPPPPPPRPQPPSPKILLQGSVILSRPLSVMLNMGIFFSAREGEGPTFPWV